MENTDRAVCGLPWKTVFTYQLSFSSKTRKSSANSSTSFFTPRVLEATQFIKLYISTIVYVLCDAVQKHNTNHLPALSELEIM